MARRKIPREYILLREAFDRFGRHLFREEWNGEEIGPDISDMKGDLREIRFGALPGPALRPQSDTEPGKRRDEAEGKFRQIMYAEELQAFSYNIVNAEMSEIPFTNWLAISVSLSIEYSIVEWFDDQSREHRRGTIVFKREEFASYLNKGEKTIDKDKTQEPKPVRSKTGSKAEVGLTNEARARGGSKSKYHVGLQQAINRVGEDLAHRGEKLTQKPFTARIIKNTTGRHGTDESTIEDDRYSFDPPIPDCDWLYIDGRKLVWRDHEGLEQERSLRSLTLYFKRAKTT